MPLLHDPSFRTKIESRLKSITPDTRRKWGSMSAPQMLWHVNQFLGFALGDETPEASKSPMPKSLMRFFLLYMPWPKGAPTHKQAIAKEPKDFEAERAKCLKLIDRFVSKSMESEWPHDPIFDFKTGKSISQMQAKHLDHHLRQFGA
jgi:hypothetical protein